MYSFADKETLVEFSLSQENNIFFSTSIEVGFAVKFLITGDHGTVSVYPIPGLSITISSISPRSFKFGCPEA